MRPLPVENFVQRELLEPLRGKRVLIVGASGFCGRWLLETLYRFSTGLDTRISASFHDPKRAYESCHQFVDVYGAFKSKSYRFDYIAHCTLDGLGLDESRRYLAPGGKFLHLSSGAVCVNPKVSCTRPICETDPPCAMDGYGRMKWEQDVQAIDFAVIARLFSFIGPGLRRHTGREFLEANPIQVNNDGAVRSYLYAGDMAAWLWTLLIRGETGRIYNVGSSEPTAVTTFAVKCAEARKVAISCQPMTTGGTYYVPNTDRVASELGLRQTVGLTEAIERTLAWQKS